MIPVYCMQVLLQVVPSQNPSLSGPPLSRILSVSKAGGENLASHEVALEDFYLHVMGKS